MTKQQTQWLFRYPYKNGRLRAGWVYNLNPKRFNNPRDNVRLQWEVDGKAVSDLYMRPDEALAMAAGLTWVVGEKAVGTQESETQNEYVV